MFSIPQGPRRIVCLTEEPTEILYALGESERIVGISAYTVRPPEAKRDKPVVSAFIDGSLSKISALQPDLIIGFSDIQAKLAKDLISAGLPVLIFNQRSLQEILEVICTIGSIVGQRERALALVDGYIEHIETVRQAANKNRGPRPRVYFEEWDEPIITGIRWVKELIEIAGGDPLFSKQSLEPGAKERILTIDDVVLADPEVYLASWCGKPFDKNSALARPGMATISAARNKRVHEIESSIILQPGPACISDGLDCLAQLIRGAK